MWMSVCWRRIHVTPPLPTAPIPSDTLVANA